MVIGELESVSSEETAEEVAVEGGASPGAVLGVGTEAWAQTPSPAETAPSTSSAYYQPLALSCSVILTEQVARRHPKNDPLAYPDAQRQVQSPAPHPV